MLLSLQDKTKKKIFCLNEILIWVSFVITTDIVVSSTVNLQHIDESDFFHL